MLARSILSSYSRLLAGVALAFLAVALAGCNEKVAEKPAPSRPVLVATAHYEAETPERSFVGTIKPRIEADMGFRVPGKVAKRLVEVGQTVDIGQPLATLDEVDLKLQAEQAVAEFSAATGVRGAGRRRRDARQGIARQGLDHRCAARFRARRRRRSPRAAQSRRALGRSHQELTLLRDAGGGCPRRRDGDPDRAGPGGCRGPDRDPGRTLCREGSRGRDPRDAGRSAPRPARATVTLWSEPNKKYAAKLREISPSADPATRTYLAKFSLPEVGDNVELGMTATLTLCDQKTARVARLPLSALYNAGDKPSLLCRRRRRRHRAEAGHHQGL